jgi:multiple sugar transport system ATP-binding protein
VGDVLLKGVQKSYGPVHVLKHIDLSIKNGEFVVFVGPSGCGKSTLLRSIAGLEEITGGELSIGGRVVNDVPPAERGIAMVFQSYALYPHMNLRENMAFGLELAKVPKAEIDTAVNQAAKVLRIDHLLERKPKDLSGGQRQRVAIGRAIVRKPKVFLFDEPLSNLDAALRVEMRYEFAKLHDELKATMIYVTHDQVEAMTLADRIVVLSAGHVEQVGSPLELYEHPKNKFVAGFIGSPQMNFAPCTLLQSLGAQSRVKLASGAELLCDVDTSQAKAGDAMILGLRPEHISVTEAGGGDNRLSGQVRFVETLGSATQAYCDLAGLEKPLSVTLDGRQRPKRGDALALQVPTNATYLFAADDSAYPRTATAGAL